VGGEDRLLRVPLRAMGGAVRGEGGQSVRPAPACDSAVFFSVCLCLWIWSVGTRVYMLARGRAVLVHGPLVCSLGRRPLYCGMTLEENRLKKFFLVLSTR